MPPPFCVPGANHLIALLQPATRARIEARLTRQSLSRGEYLYRADERVEHVHFPLGGIVSLTIEMEDGLVVEVGTIGNEGMTAIPLVHGAATSPTNAFSQIAGDALRMSAGDFEEEFARHEDFARVISRYAQAFYAQVAQSTACNRLHPVEQRMARWLLMSQDRTGSDIVPLTQEFLGQMLGVRRASVNVVAGMLQQAGFIRYSRGVITVLDRSGLESASCECYMIVQRHFERLLSPA
jgi:CRP-like cAMP-binding protein